MKRFARKGDGGRGSRVWCDDFDDAVFVGTKTNKQTGGGDKKKEHGREFYTETSKRKMKGMTEKGNR